MMGGTTSSESAEVLSGPGFNQPWRRISLGDFFFENGKKFSERICQIDGMRNQLETYSSVIRRSVRLAIAMRERGITQEDVITLCCSNTLDTIIPILAAFFLGAKVSNLEPSLSMRHTKHLLYLVEPKIIFVEESALKLIQECLVDVEFETELIVFGENNDYTSFSQLVVPQPAEEDFKPTEVDTEDVAVMFFTSGTMGLPKAICHSHNSFMLIAHQLHYVGTTEAILHFSSFYWITAMLMLTCSFKTGTYRVFCEDHSSREIFRIIEQYKVAYIFMAPILTHKLTDYENAKKYDTSSLKLIFCGGTPMAPCQIEKMNNLFKNAFTSLLFTLTEGGMATVFGPEIDRDLARKKMARSSSGRVAPGMKLKISDIETDTPLGPYQKGEIRLKSPCTMKGYYKRESSDVFDTDGFLKTGDVGYYDHDGFVYVDGRIKEMFKYQSWHIVPALIEAAILEHPSIKNAIVVGVPCGEEGEVPAAVIVLKENCMLNKEDVHEFLEERVSDREKLRGGVFFVETLPTTTTGKFLRKKVRDIVLVKKLHGNI